MYKAFIVEDELVVREGLREKVSWEEANFTLCGEASDGELALSLIEELRPDLIITDVRMPFMDGLEMSRIVRKILPTTKIVVISGYDDFEYAKQAIGVQATDYLLKPVGASDLMAVLHRVRETLDREESERQQRLAEAENSRDSMVLLRERFMNDLTTGMLGSANAIEIGKQVGLNLVHRFFCAALIRFGIPGDRSNGEGYSICRDGERLVREMVEDRPDVVFFRRNLTESVLVFMGDSGDELDTASSQLCKTIKFELERRTPIAVLIAIGTVEERVPRIAESLNRAVSAGQFRYIFGDASIIDYRDIERLRFREAEQDTIDSATIIERLRYGSIDDAEQEAADYLASLRTSASGPAVFTWGLVNLITLLSGFIEELGGDAADVLGEPDELERIATNGHERTMQIRFLADRIQSAMEYRENCRQNKYGDVIHKAKSFIRESYSDPEMSLMDVAGHVGVSASHFSTIFSQETGQTFIHYLTEVRMENASRLLKTTHDRSSDIAYKVGYKDPHYFSFAFKKNVGMTPSEFRKK